MLDLDVVRGEVAQAGRHDAHQPVEHDLQHRQALVGDQARADDALDAAAVLAGRRSVVETEQAVDFGLVQHPGRLRAVGGGGRVVSAIGFRAVGLRAPGRGKVFVGLTAGRLPVRCVLRSAHWISSSVNSTSFTCAGAAATLARAISSSRRR